MKPRADLIEELMDCYFHGAITGFVQTKTLVRVRFSPYTNIKTKNEVRDYIYRNYSRITNIEIDSYDNQLVIIYDSNA
jgi:hypothetical protein